MSESMVERVARGMTRKLAQQMADAKSLMWNPNAEAMQSYVDRHWQEVEGVARAAIETMREPTKAMIAAGNRDIYRVMIAAALSESSQYCVDCDKDVTQRCINPHCRMFRSLLSEPPAP